MTSERPHPSLAERQQLGPIELHSIAAASMTEAHHRLGELLAGPARWALKKRLAATPPPLLAEQIAHTRACRAFMERRTTAPSVAAPVRRALAEYCDCLSAWTRPLGLSSLLAQRRLTGEASISEADLALWAQDDNSGCQTGMLRQTDGSVLIWHSEEDTIGYFDRPRIVSMAIGAQAWSAFLYPYLLPGPAFGWRNDQFHAVDSLHVPSRRPGGGTLSGVASWLVWRLGHEVDVGEVLRALSPFVDGCALHVARTDGGHVVATTHEFGDSNRTRRRLGTRGGDFIVQVNIVSDPQSVLGQKQHMRKSARKSYERRLGRMQTGVERLLKEPGGPTPQGLLRMMCSRRGGGFAYANADVKAHAVARISAAGVEVHAESGPAHEGDVYSPRWRSII